MTEVSDADLITKVREGEVAAFGTLYERHVSAAYNLARQLSRNQSQADDLVSEAFARVLNTLRTGRGPESAFRPYLLTALRHHAYDRTAAERRERPVGDMTAESVSVQFADTAVAGLERSLVARAFARLPERWQMVLWHTEIERDSPAEVAPMLGITANGVSALAYRAREGLRQAYLQVHLAEVTEDGCRVVTGYLGAWTRAGLSKRETALVEKHLDECDRCRALAAELADVNSGMRACIAPLVLGVGAVGYVAAVVKVSTTVVVAGTTAGAAGAAGAGAASSLPRQMIGVGASASAVAAAVALALGGGDAGQAPPLPTPATSVSVTPSTSVSPSLPTVTTR